MRECRLCGERRSESRLEQVGENDWICVWRVGCEHRQLKLEKTLEKLAGLLRDTARADDEGFAR